MERLVGFGERPEELVIEHITHQRDRDIRCEQLQFGAVQPMCRKLSLMLLGNGVDTETDSGVLRQATSEQILAPLRPDNRER
jgi:hypothetical protein